MKVSERFICPPKGEDKRRYLWWARRVLDESNIRAARLTGGGDIPALVQFSEVPSWGLAYLVNEFHASGLWKLVSAVLDEPVSARGDVNRLYTASLISPVSGKVSSAAALDWYHSMMPEEDDSKKFVYGEETR